MKKVFTFKSTMAMWINLHFFITWDAISSIHHYWVFTFNVGTWLRNTKSRAILLP
jgi:hypothetical protein